MKTRKTTIFAALIAAAIFMMAMSGCTQQQGTQSPQLSGSVERFFDAADNGSASWDYLTSIEQQDHTIEVLTVGQLYARAQGAGWQFGTATVVDNRFPNLIIGESYPAAFEDTDGDTLDDFIYIADKGFIYRFEVGNEEVVSPEPEPEPLKVGDVIDPTADRANRENSVSYAMNEFVYGLIAEGKSLAEIEPLLLEKWNSEFRFYRDIAAINNHLDPGSGGQAATAVSLQRWSDFQREKNWQSISNAYYHSASNAYRSTNEINDFRKNNMFVREADRLVATFSLENGVTKHFLVECMNEIKEGERTYVVPKPDPSGPTPGPVNPSPSPDNVRKWVERVVLTPDKVSLYPGQNWTFTVTSYWKNSNGTTWHEVDAGVLHVESPLRVNGRTITVPNNTRPGTYKAWAIVEGERSNDAIITVLDPNEDPGSNVTITNVFLTLNPTSVLQGNSTEGTVVVEYSNGNRVTNPSGAVITTNGASHGITVSGRTIRTSTNTMPATYSAQATVGGKSSSWVQFNVIRAGQPEKTVVSVDISPMSASVQRGGHQDYVATVRYSDGTTGSNATIRTNNGNLSVVGNRVNVAAMTTLGNYEVWAEAGGVPSSKARLTVVDSQKTVTGITLTPANSTRRAGEEQIYLAEVTYSDGSTDNNVTMSANNAGITFSIMTAKIAESVPPASYTITATANADSSKKATATLVVEATGYTVKATIYTREVFQNADGSLRYEPYVARGDVSINVVNNEARYPWNYDGVFYRMTQIRIGDTSGTVVSFRTDPGSDYHIWTASRGTHYALLYDLAVPMKPNPPEGTEPEMPGGGTAVTYPDCVVELSKNGGGTESVDLAQRVAYSNMQVLHGAATWSIVSKDSLDCSISGSVFTANFDNVNVGQPHLPIIRITFADGSTQDFKILVARWDSDF